MTEEKQLVRTAALITNHRRQAAHHEEDLMKHLGKSPVNTKVAVAVVSILLMAAAAGATQPGTWAAKADLPENLYFMATAEVSGIIYTFGGSSGEGIDQAVVRGTLDDIAGKIASSTIRKTAMILVGRALADDAGATSKLYDAGFSHEYREKKP